VTFFFTSGRGQRAQAPGNIAVPLQSTGGSGLAYSRRQAPMNAERRLAEP
jgi:hypothetical protein